MSGQSSRRTLLKLAVALPVSLPVFDVVAAVDHGAQAVYPVQNQPRSATVSTGAIVVIDRTVTAWDGDGYYLYPDWGQPVVYQVRRQGNKLAFHYPGNDTPLWHMASGDGKVLFSGRVDGVLSKASDAAAVARIMADTNLPLLEVPAQAAI